MFLYTLQFIVDVAATLLGGAFLLRFWLQVVRIRPPAAVATFIFQTTDWFVRPLRRFIPGFKGYDWVCLLGALLTAGLMTLFECWLSKLFFPKVIGLLTLLALIKWVLYGWMGMLILQVIFSWINPNAPLAPFINALTWPLTAPVRRILPTLGGLDFSVLVVFLILQLLLRFSVSLISANLI